MANPVNLTKLSAAKLLAEIAKRDEVHSALLSETIAAGYGNTKHSELADLAQTKAYPLLVEYMAAFNELHEARAELNLRQRWHGSDRPIKLP
jgi:hypothetical protein